MKKCKKGYSAYVSIKTMFRFFKKLRLNLRLAAYSYYKIYKLHYFSKYCDVNNYSNFGLRHFNYLLDNNAYYLVTNIVFIV